jgi:hypothetical protein
MQIMTQAAPGIRRQVLFRAQQSGSRWIQVHVIASGFEVPCTTTIDNQGLVTATEEVAKKLVPAIETAGVSSQQPFHTNGQIGLGCFDDQVKMVGHQAPGMEPPSGFLTGLAQSSEKEIVVNIILENRFPSIPTVHDVVESPGVLHTQFPGHDKL